MQIKECTYRGNRDVNEDAIGVFEKNNQSCCVICDGLGGHGMGDVASKLVVDACKRLFDSENNINKPIEFLERAFLTAQGALLTEQISKHAENKMKTTAVACITDERKLYAAHVGDSRLYVFNNNMISRRTLDHSIPQMLALSGEIKESEIRNHPDRNLLLRVMGVDWERDMFELMKPIPLRKCQAVLLCTDGFWELIEEDAMCKLLGQAHNVDEWLDSMIREVEINGQGRDMDNYSAIAIWV